MLLIAVPLLGASLYFIHGSLEAFPTEEQQEKVKLATGTISLTLITVEIGLGLLLVTSKRE